MKERSKRVGAAPLAAVAMAILAPGWAGAPARPGAAVAIGAPGAPAAPAGEATARDTSGMALLEWSYDTWTVPWVQVRGGGRLLDPASHTTLMTLTCETSVLERDRKVRHLSPEECEHRMAAIRADQDTALIFRVDLRVLDESGGSHLVRLDPRVQVVLETDEGWEWAPVDVRHGLRLGMATGGNPRRIVMYHPQWMRGSDYIHRDEYRIRGGRNVTLAEHWLRFPCRDPKTGEPVLATRTRWLRLRLLYGANEWAATWPFLPDEGRAP